MSFGQLLTSVLMNLGYRVLSVFIFSTLAYFFWNTGATWLVPSFDDMPFKVALALNSGLMVIHLTVAFWYNKAIRLKAMSMALLEMRKAFEGGEKDELEN